MTLAVWALYLGRDWDCRRFIDSIVDKNFVGPGYYWMFPFRRFMIEKFHTYHARRRNIPEIREVLKVLEYH